MTEPTADADQPIVRCSSIIHVYVRGDDRVVALDGLDLDVARGEFLTVVGSSGSGKSTLLRLLAGLEQPSTGSLVVDGQDLARMNASRREEHRRRTVGYVSQQTADNLLPYLDARTNIEFPMSLAGMERAERRHRVDELLDIVGLADRGQHRPAELSGGEQQRVALAVALANSPAVLLADEPTGELDSATSDELLDIFNEAVRSTGITIIAVTHDLPVAERSGRTVSIRDGRIEAEVDRRADGSTNLAAIDRRGLLALSPTQRIRFADRRAVVEDHGDHLVLRPSDRSS